MDIFFQDVSETPQPPTEVRIRTLKAEPYLDGRRVRVGIEITPFQKRPSLELTITASDGQTVAEADILETMIPRLELVLHLRGSAPAGEYTLHARLFYASHPNPEDTRLPEPLVVHAALTTFTI